MNSHTDLLLLVIILASSFISVVVGEPTSKEMSEYIGASTSLGRRHYCVIEQRLNYDEIGGQAKCYGDHELEPPSNGTFVQVVTGSNYGCGLTPDQTVQCWGRWGASPVEGFFRHIDGADNHVCGILTDGQINCFGHHRFEHDKTMTDRKFTQISCSKNHCCALEDDGTPYCFDAGNEKPHHMRVPTISKEQAEKKRKLQEEEEDGYEDEEVVVKEGGEKVKFARISVGDNLSCGLHVDTKALTCWGKSAHVPDHRIPQNVPGPFRSLGVGQSGVCAIYDEIKEDEGGAATAEKDPNMLRGDKKEDGFDSAEDIEEASEEKNLDAEIQKEEKEESKTAKAVLVGPKKSHSMKCFGHWIEHNISQEDMALEWDQVTVGLMAVCAVTMDSSLRCWGEHSAFHAVDSEIVVA